jgi:uncharacterized membrane protein
LPNSFYLISDLIHLRISASTSILFDLTMLLSFSINGLVSGMASVYLVHKQLIKRVRARSAHMTITIVIFVSSFAIYLGRFLRWNTWDVVANPAGLLFDISDRIINPMSHPQAIVTTLTFFILLGSIYYAVWQFLNVVRHEQ